MKKNYLVSLLVALGCCTSATAFGAAAGADAT
jgi:hypothetical protein